MAKLEGDTPAQNRSPSELKFVLRNAQRKTGPDVFRDLARGEEEERTATAKPERPRPHRTKTLY